MLVLASLSAIDDDTAFAAVVGVALREAMSQSRSIRLVEPAEVAGVLSEMERDRSTALTDELAQEVAQRDPGHLRRVLHRQEQARAGIDAGLIVWSQTESRLRAALVLAPDEPLLRATAGFVACGLAAQNALGIMAPPETSVMLEWGGAIRMNGAQVGHLQLFASDTQPDAAGRSGDHRGFKGIIDPHGQGCG